MSRFILDACSIIAFVNAEEGSGKMKTLLENAANEFYMHMLNLGEVYYGFYKVEGREKAETVIENLMQLPINFVEDMSIDFVKTAGKYKANHRISFADAFVLALAEKRKGKVVTTDHAIMVSLTQSQRKNGLSFFG